MKSRKRILLGQLASNGDCLYATTVARQIKTDYPDCHLTWAIGSRWRSIIDGNPDVDEVWEIPYYDVPGHLEQWKRFEVEARSRQKNGDFDEVFLTQFSLDNLHFWTGGVREAILRAYRHPITVNKTPVVRLSNSEVENVRQFATHHQLTEKSQVILFECGPRSEQSLVNPQFALDFARHITKKLPDVAVVLSSYHSFESDHPGIIDGSELTVRENAELTSFCSLLIGASSGITWIATSDWAKSLPMVQLVIPDAVRSNSVAYDFAQRGADASQLIEMHRYDLQTVVDCAAQIISIDFASTKSKYHQTTPFNFRRYQDYQYLLMLNFRLRQCFQLFSMAVKEYGLRAPFVWIPFLLIFKAALSFPRRVTARVKRVIFRR